MTIWTPQNSLPFEVFYIKNVVVASLDIEIYSVVQGDRKTTDRLCQKNKKNFLLEMVHDLNAWD